VSELQAELGQIREEGVMRFSELSLTRRDGQVVDLEVIANIYTEKKSQVVQFNIRDISERKKFERQFQHTQKLESLGILTGGIEPPGFSSQYTYSRSPLSRLPARLVS
jgi:hypothetical protein